jgi:hypothetical protein
VDSLSSDMDRADVRVLKALRAIVGVLLVAASLFVIVVLILLK